MLLRLLLYEWHSKLAFSRIWMAVIAVLRCVVMSSVLLLLQAGQPRSFADLENDLLKGQKLQGVLTSDEVQVGTRLLECWGLCGHTRQHAAQA